MSSDLFIEIGSNMIDYADLSIKQSFYSEFITENLDLYAKNCEFDLIEHKSTIGWSLFKVVALASKKRVANSKVWSLTGYNRIKNRMTLLTQGGIEPIEPQLSNGLPQWPSNFLGWAKPTVVCHKKTLGEWSEAMLATAHLLSCMGNKKEHSKTPTAKLCQKNDADFLSPNNAEYHYSESMVGLWLFF